MLIKGSFIGKNMTVMDTNFAYLPTKYLVGTYLLAYLPTLLPKNWSQAGPKAVSR